MRTPPLSTPISGTRVHPVRTHEDESAALSLLMDLSTRVAFDVETTGVGFYDDLRLVQFSDLTDAYCFEPQRWPKLATLLAARPNCVAHNAGFDAHHLARFCGLDVTQVLDGVTDTMVLARIVDPRTKKDGYGHGLKYLAAKYVDPDAPDGDKALMARFHELGFNKATGYAGIDIDDPTYLMYGGLDCIMTNRLVEPLMELIQRHDQVHLVQYDHQVEMICAKMRSRGMRVDQPYSKKLTEELLAERDLNTAIAASLGVENINSTKQVADGLRIRGCELTETTDKGHLKVDKVILKGLDDDLARAIVAAKTASKAVTSWVTPFLDHAQHDGRVHCNIKTGSITYRLSASEPNLMNLPSGDWTIRRCLVADEGQSLISCDFSQVELRTVAVLAKEPRMIEVFKSGEDMHTATATKLFGSEHTPAERKLAKNTAFGIIYGGGADTLARQAGVSRSEARKAIQRFYRSYPRIQRWSDHTIQSIREKKPIVVTHTGRRIPVDPRLAYKATNYAVQSLACDIFRDALIKLDKAGLDLLLPVHDEIITQAPQADAQDMAREVARIMTDDLDGCPITADADVVGPSWGHAYGAPEVLHV
jgi:DNA polymerase-1